MKRFVFVISLISLMLSPLLGGTQHIQTSWHVDGRQTIKQHFNPEYQHQEGLSAEQLAWNYLQQHSASYGLESSLDSLRLERVTESLLGTHIHFQQVINDVPVAEGSLVVSLRKDDQRIYQVYNNTFPVSADQRLPKIVLDAEDAYDIAWLDLRVHGDLMARPEVKQYYQYEKGQFRLVYETFLGVEAPFGYFIHKIDAQTGKIIDLKDGAISRLARPLIDRTYEGPIDHRPTAFRLFEDSLKQVASSKQSRRVNGTGKVFDPDPRTTLQDEDLQDNSPASAFTAAYFTRDLLDITESGGTWELTGPWVYISDFEPPNTQPSTTTDGNWTAERGNNAFNDAVVYFHIDQNQRYMQSLGFSGASGIQEGSIEADSDGLSGADNSHYIPSTNQLAWGHGCVDDSEDMFVVLHEYGHAIQHSIQPSNWSGGDTGAMGEGFSDYWAGSYKYSTPNGPVFHPEWAFAWDGHGTGNLCWAGRIMDALAARYDHATFYGAHSSIPGGFQSDELWSTPLFQAFLEIIAQGGTREEVDTIILESHFGIGAGPKMRDMANATINTASLLFPSGPHADIFIQKFLHHEIIEIPTPIFNASNSQLANAGTNGVADPGETVSLTVTVTNDGTLGATNINATLTTSTPMVTIVQGNSTYPDLGVGESGQNQSVFEIYIDPLFTCGDAIDLNLELQYDEPTRATRNITIDMGTGVPQGADDSVSPGLTISDNSSIQSDLTITGTGATVTANFSVDVDITHTYIGDLEVTIESPAGTMVILHDNSGGTTDNLVGNYPGTLTPAQPLSTLIGENLDGTWILHVTDSATGDTGTLNTWGISDVTGYDCESGQTCDTTSLSVDAGSDLIACSSVPLALEATGQGGVPGYTYEWTHPELLDDETSATPMATLTATTTFEVTITDDMGCTRTDEIVVYVYDSVMAFLPVWLQGDDPSHDFNGDQMINILDPISWVSCP